MPIDRADDTIAFRDFLDAKLAASADFTLDETLVEWESANEADDDHEETLRAIREGLAGVAVGRSRPFEEFEREFRARHGLPARS